MPLADLLDPLVVDLTEVHTWAAVRLAIHVLGDDLAQPGHWLSAVGAAGNWRRGCLGHRFRRPADAAGAGAPVPGGSGSCRSAVLELVRELVREPVRGRCSGRSGFKSDLSGRGCGWRRRAPALWASMYLLTSLRVILPPSPVPTTRARSTSFSAASLRTTGDSTDRFGASSLRPACGRGWRRRGCRHRRWLGLRLRSRLGAGSAQESAQGRAPASQPVPARCRPARPAHR